MPFCLTIAMNRECQFTCWKSWNSGLQWMKNKYTSSIPHYSHVACLMLHVVYTSSIPHIHVLKWCITKRPVFIRQWTTPHYLQALGVKGPQIVLLIWWWTPLTTIFTNLRGIQPTTVTSTIISNTRWSCTDWDST